MKAILLAATILLSLAEQNPPQDRRSSKNNPALSSLNGSRRHWDTGRYGTGSHVRQDKREEHRPNPPNGSWGMVKVQPTQNASPRLNPPNGSWGMVK
ncbi:MAG: hypothetical protein ACREA2_10970, partial [Blastocatellia bacterium]